MVVLCICIKDNYILLVISSGFRTLRIAGIFLFSYFAYCLGFFVFVLCVLPGFFDFRTLRIAGVFLFSYFAYCRGFLNFILCVLIGFLKSHSKKIIIDLSCHDALFFIWDQSLCKYRIKQHFSIKNQGLKQCFPLNIIQKTALIPVLLIFPSRTLFLPDLFFSSFPVHSCVPSAQVWDLFATSLFHGKELC